MEEKIEKFNDYWEGLKQVAQRGFTVGAVITDEKEAILSILENEGVETIESTAKMDEVFKTFFEKVGQGEKVGIVIEDSIEPKIIGLIKNFQSGQASFRLAGEAEPRVLNPLPKGGVILLIVNSQEYENIEWLGALTSVCRL